MSVNDILIPCPFCGGHCAVTTLALGGHYAECECGISTAVFDDLNDLISFWNTRSDGK